MLLSFLLVVLGITSVLLQMLGISWYFLSFLDLPGRLFAFVIKVLMVLAGVLIAVFANTDWEKERKESE